MTYEDQLQDLRWKHRRAEILHRDGHRCQAKNCEYGKELNVHHTDYIKGRMAWDYPDQMLITLCRKCHAKEHGIDPESTGDNLVDAGIELGRNVACLYKAIHAIKTKEEKNG